MYIHTDVYAVIHYLGKRTCRVRLKISGSTCALCAKPPSSTIRSSTVTTATNNSKNTNTRNYVKKKNNAP